MITRPRPAPLAVLLCAVVALSLLPSPPAAAQGASADVDQYFRVEWSPEAVPRGGWAVEGYVYSTHPFRVNGVRLLVEVLDAAGGVENRVFGWVSGDVPSGGRAYFFVSVPRRGAAYRVKVLSYFPVARESN